MTIQGLPRLPKKQLHYFLERVRSRESFTFVRFSDGELEILRNHEVEISEKFVYSSFGKSSYNYPRFDHKRFRPESGEAIRRALVESLAFTHVDYFKGVPASHNQSRVFDARAAREFCYEIGGSCQNNQWAFADIFVNSNYLSFKRLFIPVFWTIPNLVFIGNYRMNPFLLNPQALHIQVPDGAFDNFSTNVERIVSEASDSPEGAVVLSSASSMSNVVGHRLRLARPDLTFIDVGTALHSTCALPGANRLYQALDLSRPSDLLRIGALISSKQFWLRW